MIINMLNEDMELSLISKIINLSIEEINEVKETFM